MFLDLNSNGVQEAGEPSTRTNADGTYFLSYDASLDLSQAQLAVTGGMDSGTGLPVPVTYTAALGSDVITPFTTLIQRLTRHNGLTPSAALDKVQAVFELDPNLDLTDFDPLGELLSDDPEDALVPGSMVFREEVKLTVLVTQVASLAAGADGSTSLPPEFDKVWDNLADLVNGATTLPDLTNAAAVDTLLTSLLQGTSTATIPAETITGVADNIALGFQEFDEIALPTTTGDDVDDARAARSFSQDVAKAEIVTQNNLTTGLNQVASGSLSLAQFDSDFENADFESLETAAVAGTLDPVEVFISDVETQSGADGSIVYTYTVELEDVPSSIEPVSIDFATADGTATAASGDYLPASGKLTWASGDLAPKTFTVTVPPQADVEPEQTFQVNFSNAKNAVAETSFTLASVPAVTSLPPPPPGPAPGPAPVPTPAPLRLTASLITKKVGKKKVQFVVVNFSDGRPAREIRSRYQKPSFKGIAVAVVDGVVKVTAKKGKKTVTTTVAV